MALVILTARITPGDDDRTGFMSFAVSGASALAASDALALIREHGGSSSTGYIQASAIYHLTGLNPGSNTFTAQYRSTGGSSSFQNRSIIVIPLP